MNINYFLYFLMILLLVFLIYKIYARFYNSPTTIQNNNDMLTFTNDHIIFLTQEETRDFLLHDNDKYVNNMSVVDLYARHVSTNQEYLQKIADIADEFTPEEKEKLSKCAQMSDNFYNTMNFSEYDYYKSLNGKEIANNTWKFALTYKNKDKEYEDGLPHTREDIIFLSKSVVNYNEVDLTNTLIHEKLHIYQRYNKDKMNMIIKDMRYSILDPNKLESNDKELMRSNPDLDDIIYYDNKTNKLMSCKYNSKTPQNISDVEITNFSIEHPYEKMAYDIASLYYKQNLSKYKDI